MFVCCRVQEKTFLSAIGAKKRHLCLFWGRKNYIFVCPSSDPLLDKMGSVNSENIVLSLSIIVSISKLPSSFSVQHHCHFRIYCVFSQYCYHFFRNTILFCTVTTFERYLPTKQ